MKLDTSRFGTIEIQSDDILFFRFGMFGFEDQQHWVLLSDAKNSAVAWLQSLKQADLAMPVVSPRRFVEEYQVKLDGRQIDLLNLQSEDQAYVLSIVSRHGPDLTTNLRAPVVINLDRRLGCQVVTADDQEMMYKLAEIPTEVRRSA